MTYYLLVSQAADGRLVFCTSDAEEFQLLKRSCVHTETIAGKRATVVLYSLECGFFRWAALSIAIAFMNGAYRVFDFKSMEWRDGEKH